MKRMIRSPLFLMALTVFIDFTGFGLVIPLLPFWAEHLGADAVGVGLILTVYSLAQFLFTPVLGGLSDRWGRRPIILWSLLVETLGFALTALSPNLIFLLVVRFLSGLGASNMGTAQAVVADTTTPEKRARGMGMIGAAIGLGFIVGPALSGFASANAGLPFWIAAGLALANALLVFFFLPETRKGEEKKSQLNPMSLLIAGWQKAIRYPVILRLVVINLLFLVAFASMESVFALFTQQEFHWEASQNAFIFTYLGVLMVIMQGGLVGRLVKRFGEKRLLLSGLTFLTLGLLLLPLSTNLAFLVVAMGILAIGEGAVTPISSTLLSFSTPREVQGEILGLSQGVGGLGRVVGPLLATTLFAWGGAWFSFGLAALLAVIALLLAIPHIPTPQRNAAVHSEEMPATS